MVADNRVDVDCVDKGGEGEELSLVFRHPGSETDFEKVTKRLDRAYNKEWQKQLWDARLNAIKESTEKFEAKKSWASWKAWHELRLQGHKLSTIHRAACLFPLKKPKIGSYKRFHYFMTVDPGYDEEKFLQYLAPKKRGIGNTKIGLGLSSVIFDLYADDRKLTFEQIAVLVNELLNTELSLGTNVFDKYSIPHSSKNEQRLSTGKFVSAQMVKRTMTLEKRTLAFGKRNGKSREREAITRKNYQIEAQHAFDRVEIDCTTFTFIFIAKDGKPSTKLTTWLAVDCSSRAVVGVHFDYSENGDLYRSGLESMTKFWGLLPAELVFDQFPGHNSEPIKQLFKQLRELNVTVTIDRTGNPRTKATVEKAVDLIADELKLNPKFVGKNITTKSESSRRSKERIRSLTLTSQLNTENEVRQFILDGISSYNQRVMKGKKAARMENFESSEKPNAIQLTNESWIWLFAKVSDRDVMHDGTIVISRQKKGLRKSSYFEIRDNQLRLLCSGRKMRIRYEEPLELQDHVYIFDKKTELFVGVADRQKLTHLAAVNAGQDEHGIKVQRAKSEKEFRNFLQTKRAEISTVEVDWRVVNHLNASKSTLAEAEQMYILQKLAAPGFVNTSLDSQSSGERPDRLDGFDEPQPLDEVVVEKGSWDRLDQYDKPLPLSDDDLNFETIMFPDR
ncbi:MAG: hypothetical protein ACK5WO_01570 [Cyclobacteriaceae bacterium]